MKFSEQWLREWVNPSLRTAELSAQLTMAGLEVDAIEPVAAEFGNVVVGEILKIDPHPDADKLRVCQVNVGQATPLTIVCGASNVAVGMKVPAALIGAQLPGGIQIKKAKLRGVESSGMLCSAKELGMTEESEGLLPLAKESKAGEDVRKILGLDDVSITLGLTPNRGDCLSVRGIAREVAVLNNLSFQDFQTQAVNPVLQDKVAVSLEAPNVCPRYCGRVIRGVDTQAASPFWLQERLRRSGIRSLGAIVDITNLILLELGQPMHAFDLGKLKGSIHVRLAKQGEKLTLLNNETIEIRAGTLVIADDVSPQALAGIMGGMDSSVGPATQDILLESAFFDPTAMAGQARGYGLHTDSSHRFERGVDPNLQLQAIERATELILKVAGGKPGPVVEAVSKKDMVLRSPITLREERFKRVLGISLEKTVVEKILLSLGMQVDKTQQGWLVTPPTHRFDVTLEVDLIEEVARVYGYHRLPEQAMNASLQMVDSPEGLISIQSVCRHLISLGYQEVITYSFVDPQLQKMLDPENQPVRLRNPISSDMAVMRTNLWPGLISTMQYNLHRQQTRLMLFENGLRYRLQQPDFNQVMMLAGLLTGSTVPEQWGTKSRAIDFFDVKGHLQSIFSRTGRHFKRFEFTPASHPALHPGQSAKIIYENKEIGWIGAMHPQLKQALSLGQDVYLFEIEMAAITSGSIPKFSEVSKFPAIRRDIAIVVSQEISAQQVQICIKKAAPGYLQNIELFDVYTGEGIDSGRKSVALGLTLQDLSRTLTDSEVEDVMQKIVGSLQVQLGASLR